jgi:hypothetical protein
MFCVRYKQRIFLGTYKLRFGLGVYRQQKNPAVEQTSGVRGFFG